MNRRGFFAKLLGAATLAVVSRYGLVSTETECFTPSYVRGIWVPEQFIPELIEALRAGK